MVPFLVPFWSYFGSQNKPQNWPKISPKTATFGVNFLIENWSKITNIDRNWTKLARNSVELVVPEALGGVPEPDLGQNGPKSQRYKKKSCVQGNPLYIFIYYTIYGSPYVYIYIYIVSQRSPEVQMLLTCVNY